MSSHWSEDEAVGGVEFTLSTNFAATAKIALLLLAALLITADNCLVQYLMTYAPYTLMPHHNDPRLIFRLRDSRQLDGMK